MEKNLQKMTLKSSCAVGFRENSIQKSMLKMTDFDPQKPPKNDSEIELCRGDSQKRVKKIHRSSERKKEIDTKKVCSKIALKSIPGASGSRLALTWARNRPQEASKVALGGLR